MAFRKIKVHAGCTSKHKTQFLTQAQLKHVSALLNNAPWLQVFSVNSSEDCSLSWWDYSLSRGAHSTVFSLTHASCCIHCPHLPNLWYFSRYLGSFILIFLFDMWEDRIYCHDCCLISRWSPDRQASFSPTVYGDVSFWHRDFWPMLDHDQQGHKLTVQSTVQGVCKQKKRKGSSS